MSGLRRKFIESVGWVAGATASGRLIQLVALAVTTRLLALEDFGLLAVVTTITLLVDRFTTFGLDAALVQSPSITAEMLDVAWSYQLARNVALGVITFLAAPWLAAAFLEPTATDMVRVAALGFPISGLRNVGLVRLRREMDFRALGYCDVIPVAVYAIAAIALTILMRNVWALVLASIVLSATATAVSFFYSPHWPTLNFSWRVARPLFAFGVCLLGNTLLQTVREQGVVFVLARTVSLDELGLYNRAAAFSLSLFTQGQAMFWRVAYPAMASLQSDPLRLGAAWSRMTRWMAIGGVLTSGAYILVCPMAVRGVLGERWLSLVPIMQVFAVYAALLYAMAASEVLFQAVGRPALGTRLQAIGTAILALVLWPCLQYAGLTGAASAFLVSGVVVAPLALVIARTLIARQKPGSVPEPPPGEVGSGTNPQRS